MLWQGQREGNSFKIRQTALFFLTRSALGRKCITEPNLLGFHQSLTDMGKEKTKF